MKYIYIGSNLIDESKLVLGENTITIPAEVIKGLTVVTGNYPVSFKFFNGMVINDTVYLQIKGEPILPPVIDVEEITVDLNNIKDVEIPISIPTDSIINEITINGKKLRVVYKNLRTADLLPVVYVTEGKLVIPADTLKYIGFEDSGYKIEGVLENGEAFSKEITLIQQPTQNDNSESVDSSTTYY